MYYELRHDNDIIMILDVGKNFYIESIVHINKKEKIPIGLGETGNVTARELDEWIMDRGIPAKREGVEYILEKEEKDSVNELLIKNNCMGLRDHYWIVEEGSNLKWEDINYFENNERFGKWGDDIYLGRKIDTVDNGKTPSSSASGMQPKMWILKNGERWLLKGSEVMTKQEPYSEYAASLILDKMGISHVEYILLKDKNEILSGCKNMLNNKEELVSANYMTMYKKLNNESNFDHYIRKCVSIGLKTDYVKCELEKMIVIDYLFANTDRHWSNFSVIRSSDSLEGKRLAPLYDHGAAFFTKIHHTDIYETNKNLECKSFNKWQEKNIEHVKNIDWLNVDVLKEIPDIVRKVMKGNNGREDRVEDITHGIASRIKIFKNRFGIGR